MPDGSNRIFPHLLETKSLIFTYLQPETPRVIGTSVAFWYFFHRFPRLFDYFLIPVIAIDVPEKTTIQIMLTEP
jgi:hypothetical protein